MISRAQCLLCLACVFGFWAASALLALGALSALESPPVARPASPSVGAGVVGDSDASRRLLEREAAALRGSLEAQRRKTARLRARIAAGSRAAAAVTGEAAVLDETRTTDAAAYAAVARELAAAEQRVAELRERIDAATSAAAAAAVGSSSSSSSGGRHEAEGVRVTTLFEGEAIVRPFCLEAPAPRWCYEPITPAPPLPPSDADDLTWLERELSLQYMSADELNAPQALNKQPAWVNDDELAQTQPGLFCFV